MHIHSAVIPDVLVIEPGIFADARGFWFEGFDERTFCGAEIFP